MNQDWCFSEQVCEEDKLSIYYVLSSPKKGIVCYKNHNNIPKTLKIRLGLLSVFNICCITQL